MQQDIKREQQLLLTCLGDSGVALKMRKELSRPAFWVIRIGLVAMPLLGIFFLVGGLAMGEAPYVLVLEVFLVSVAFAYFHKCYYYEQLLRQILREIHDRMVLPTK